MLLVTGSKGQLGQHLRNLLPQAIFTDIEELDLTDAFAVLNFVNNKKIDTIINCAAYTAVDKAEDEQDKAELINHYGPLNLANTGAKVIHISTDYVFSGDNDMPYKEFDTTIPKSIYGKTKLSGEQAILKNSSNSIVIRTSWLYSKYNSNFVKTMLNLGQQRKSINVVCDQLGSPTYAGDLAEAIVAILPQLEATSGGIYHYSNEGQCSWFEFAERIMRIANVQCKVLPIDTDSYPTKAPRPAYSVLNTSKIKNTFGLSIPHWQASLEKMLREEELIF
ncbi:MAG: dTDP-4-dehydrorhamnose reductase [Pseudomonadota bacterium]|nr:dTDP-4-dehydrorhamnose reductase [Pseudomonadota bacterium]